MAKCQGLPPEKSLYEKLVALKYTPSQRLVDRSELSIKENRAVYKLLLSKSAPTVSFCVDGGIITSGQRCDYLVLVDLASATPEWMVLFIELKGTDVLHAIEQLRSTLKNGLFQHPSNKRLFARVVGRSFPSNKSDVALEKAKIEFRQNYKCDLRKLKTCQPDLHAI